MKVKCIRDRDSSGQLCLGKEYQVVDKVICGAEDIYYLQETGMALWLSSRFQVVEEEAKIMKKVRCINAEASVGLLTQGQVYQVIEEAPVGDGSIGYRLQGIYDVWWQSRFQVIEEEKVEARILKKVRCKDAEGSLNILTHGRVYEVLGEGLITQSVPGYRLKEIGDTLWCADRFEIVQDTSVKKFECHKSTLNEVAVALRAGGVMDPTPASNERLAEWLEELLRCRTAVLDAQTALAKAENRRDEFL